MTIFVGGRSPNGAHLGPTGEGGGVLRLVTESVLISVPVGVWYFLTVWSSLKRTSVCLRGKHGAGDRCAKMRLHSAAALVVYLCLWIPVAHAVSCPCLKGLVTGRPSDLLARISFRLLSVDALFSHVANTACLSAELFDGIFCLLSLISSRAWIKKNVTLCYKRFCCWCSTRDTVCLV